MGNKRVCIIEDDDIYRFLVKTMIRDSGAKADILEFSNGKEGLDFFAQALAEKSLLPDVIFLDLNMPVLDGWQFLDEFKEMEPQLPGPIPLYILSSSISFRDLERAKANPLVTAYIEKPLEEEAFLKIVNS